MTTVGWVQGKWLAWCEGCQDGLRTRKHGKALVWALHHDTARHGFTTKS